MTPQERDWRTLAEMATTEMDSVKLMALVEELNQALDRNNRKSTYKVTAADLL